MQVEQLYHQSLQSINIKQNLPSQTETTDNFMYTEIHTSTYNKDDLTVLQINF